MVSKGQFVGLDWNRITRLHSQVMTDTQELTNSIALSLKHIQSIELSLHLIHKIDFQLNNTTCKKIGLKVYAYESPKVLLNVD